MICFILKKITVCGQTSANMIDLPERLLFG